MIPATTSFVGATETHQPVRRVRLGYKALGALVFAQVLLIAFVLVAVVRVMPAPQPLVAASDYTQVQQAIIERAYGDVNDPMVSTGEGAMAPASNVRGLMLNGVTYYYYFEGQPSFDPVHRGALAEGDTRIVLRDTNGPATLVIYTLAK